MNWAFHFLGSFTDLNYLFKLIKKKIRGKENPQKTALEFKVISNSQWTDTVCGRRLRRWNRGVVGNTQWSHSPGPALIMLCCCGWEQKQHQKGQVWHQLLEQTHVPPLPLSSTHGYARGAWNKSYSVLAVVSKAAATGCSSCLLLEQLYTRLDDAGSSLSFWLSSCQGWTLSFSSIASRSSAQLMPGPVDLLWHWPSSCFQHTTKTAVCCGLENSQQQGEGNSRQGKRSQWQLRVLCQQGGLPHNTTRQEMWLCKRDSTSPRDGHAIHHNSTLVSHLIINHIQALSEGATKKWERKAL